MHSTVMTKMIWNKFVTKIATSDQISKFGTDVTIRLKGALSLALYDRKKKSGHKETYSWKY